MRRTKRERRQSMTVKLQTDVSVSRVLAYDVPGRNRFMVEFAGSDAETIIKRYHMGPMDRRFVSGLISGGELRLGGEVADPDTTGE